MVKNRGGFFRNGVAGAMIVGGHLLLIELFLYAARHPEDSTESNPPHTSVLFLLELPPPVPEPPPAPDSKPRRSSDTRPRPQPLPATANSAITAPETTPSAKPSIDWHGEAERAASTAIEEAAKNEKRKCDPEGTFLLPKCGKKKPQYKWDPEPKAIGFIGPLPYIRLGKRCILGLGFAGCDFGKLPEPSNDLYEYLKDPDRPRSSVPDAEEINRMPLGKPDN